VVLAWAVAHVSTCDCSMFVRWAMAQAGLDVGLTTSTQWTANGLLPSGDTPQDTVFVSRGVGSAAPPGGYRPSDLVFFGVDDGATGHVGLWLGNGQIVHCSSSGGGSNIRPLASYVAPTGWLRWKALSAAV
jgi:cell wall-associated NlpC family hydrolase